MQTPDPNHINDDSQITPNNTEILTDALDDMGDDSVAGVNDVNELTGAGDVDDINTDLSEISGADLEESVWEDLPNKRLVIPNDLTPVPPSPAPSSIASRESGIRKRYTKTQFLARPSSSRRAMIKVRSSKGRQSPLVEIDPDRVKDAIVTGTSSSFNYAFDIFTRGMRLLRYPFALLFALWLFAFVVSKVTSTISFVLSPVCWVPGISSSPFCYVGETRTPQWADYPKLMDVQSTTFEQLLDESVGGSSLSLEVKKAEMATADLVALVKVSDMRSRDMMAQTLRDFASDAKHAGRGLQKLSSRIGGAVDSILAVNDYALHTIESHLEKSNTGLSIIWPFGGSSTKEVVTKTFNDAMNVLSTQMERVILEAEVSLTNLDRLEQRLVTLQELVHREKYHISAERDELLAELWTILGGNKHRVRNLDGHLYVLRNIGQYRTRALAHVAAAMSTLQSMSEDMEDLRERVAAPELVGDRIPVEVHMRSIKAGLDRLSEKRYQVKEREQATIKEILGSED